MKTQTRYSQPFQGEWGARDRTPYSWKPKSSEKEKFVEPDRYNPKNQENLSLGSRLI